MKRWVPVLLVASCVDRGTPPIAGELAVSEVASKNAGGGPFAARDELGEYDDWIELEVGADHRIDLAGLLISDTKGNPSRFSIDDDEPVTAEPGSRVLLFADGETHQGPLHLPFKLDAGGESLVVSTPDGVLLSEVDVPALRAGESFASVDGAFTVCTTPTPGAPNACAPKQPPPKTTYAPYDWPDLWPPPIASDVVLAEIDPAGDWIEIHNRSERAIDLASLSLTWGGTRVPGDVSTSSSAALSGSLAPSARAVIATPGLRSSARTILAGPGVLDEEMFEAVEAGTVLALPEDGSGLRIACANGTPGEPNATCDAPVRRARPAFLRAIRSQADFDAVAEAGKGESLGARSMKFIIDRNDGNRVYFFDSERWILHFDWIWEAIEKNTPFDLCDPEQRSEHLRQWGIFSQQNYFVIEARRYYLGTVLFYPDSGVSTIEFTPGDRISPEMIREAFFLVASKIQGGEAFGFRPVTSRLESAARQIEGTLPIVGIDAPFEGQTFQILNPGVAYGVLEVVKAEELGEAPVSFQTIAILDALPNDVPPIGGTITEAFQTPLAHVNVLAQNRGTPNMALRGARTDPRLVPFIGRLARLDVRDGGFEIRAATSTEAEAFWQMRREQTGTFVPAKDLSVRDIVDLSTAGFGDIPRIGAKAAQFAELSNLDWFRSGGGVTGPCALTRLDRRLPVPRPAFAIPFARYHDHLVDNGIDALLADFLADTEAQQNPVLRRQRLTEIQTAIRTSPVDPAFLAQLDLHIRAHYGLERVRFRSSTNVEDLAGFNGAGLYESASAQAGSGVRSIADALRTVWASAWSFRGYEERTLFGVVQSEVEMGVLIHRGFPAEEVNGVAITRNVINPASHGFYINAQAGEISVVNPETGDLPEQLLYQLFFPPEVLVLARSTVTGGAPLLEDAELHRLACALSAAHNHFRDHYRSTIPEAKFAVDVEWKIDGGEVILKQARPWVERREIQTACNP
jgi:hypothetical protein